MCQVIDALALLCTAAGLIAGPVVFVRQRDGVLALRVALEFWTAAGLLRLSDAAGWDRIAAAAAITSVRIALVHGLPRQRAAPDPRR